MDDLMIRFIHWEGASRDTIDFKRCYCEITNDLVCGVLLSQIIFWFLPNKKNESKLSVFKDGRLWLCKGRHEWMSECFLTPNQFDRASKMLVDRKLIYKKNYKFNGAPTAHVSIRVENIMKALAENMKSKKISYKQSLGLKLLCGESEVISPKSDVSFLEKLTGKKLELFNSSKRYFKEKNKNVSISINSDKKMKEFLFEHFWMLYDNKSRKPAAEKEFVKLSYSDIESVFAHCETYRDYTKCVDRQFAPTRYLKDKVFNDDVSIYDYRQNQKEKEQKINYDDYYKSFNK